MKTVEHLKNIQNLRKEIDNQIWGVFYKWKEIHSDYMNNMEPDNWYIDDNEVVFDGTHGHNWSEPMKISIPFNIFEDPNKTLAEIKEKLEKRKLEQKQEKEKLLESYEKRELERLLVKYGGRL